jgi:hypothetical protein
MTDFYHDDPAEEPVAKRAKQKAIFGSALMLLAGGLFLNTTLAANISLNSSGRVEFGQGLAITTACSGSNSLTVTPNSSFTNAAGAGGFYFNSVSVSGIPTSCNGVDFTLSVYDSTTSTALPIFATNKSVARIWSDAGTFKLGSGSVSGASITSNSGAFTVSFTSPASLATNVSRLTLQSSAHVDFNCAIDGVGCLVGGAGPGGGTIFYVNDSGFSAPGSACGDNCHNLEFAPSTWNWEIGYSGPSSGDGLGSHANWGSHTGTYLRTNRVAGAAVNGTGDQAIGAGYMNTMQMALRRPSISIAAAVRRYAGSNNSAGQWFVPSLYELRELHLSSARSGGNFGTTYSSSSERDNVFYHNMNLSTGTTAFETREATNGVRPIRAF